MNSNKIIDILIKLKETSEGIKVELEMAGATIQETHVRLGEIEDQIAELEKVLEAEKFINKLEEE